MVCLDLVDYFMEVVHELILYSEIIIFKRKSVIEMEKVLKRELLTETDEENNLTITEETVIPVSAFL